jgi:uncharacterized protein (TIGR03032 family)
MHALATVGAPPADSSDSRPAAPPEPVAFHYVQSDSFVELIAELRVSLLVSTYQANKLLAVRAEGPGLSTLVRTFDRPMGIAADGRHIALGTRNQIWVLRNAPDLAPRVDPPGMYDACYLPRSSHVTGDIGVHEMAWVGDELWIVSTRFSCLATLDDDYSFVPRWRPPFITSLAAEDRCHLNGLAIRDGQPSFATMLGESDAPGGWRPNKPQGGVVIDIASGELVTGGLSMPHSPRWHNGRLWVLESGTGGVVVVDPATGYRETVVELPGFTRGWALIGRHAFVGLSMIRPTSAMDGVPIAERRDKLKCGIAVVDLRRGAVIGLLEFQTAIEEIFDVQILEGLCFPEVIGFQKDTVDHTFVVPPASTLPTLPSDRRLNRQ